MQQVRSSSALTLFLHCGLCRLQAIDFIVAAFEKHKGMPEVIHEWRLSQENLVMGSSESVRGPQ